MSEKLSKEEVRLKLLKLRYGDRIKHKAEEYGLTTEEVSDIMKDETEPRTKLAEKIREVKKKKEQRDKGTRPTKGRR